MALDRIDRRILALLQADARISNLKLADKVGLSPPACSRRVARLRRARVIEREVAVVDPRKVGLTLTAIVPVVLESRRKATLDAFARRIAARPEVQQCLMTAGSTDFVLLLRFADMAAYSTFAAERLAGDPDVKGYETWFVLGEVKNTTAVALEGAGAAMLTA
jgi:Lrp/AsnC family leucine-responsive transcriptional regulator